MSSVVFEIIIDWLKPFWGSFLKPFVQQYVSTLIDCNLWGQICSMWSFGQYVHGLIDQTDIDENIVIVQNIIRPGMDVVRPGGLSDCYISQSL